MSLEGALIEYASPTLAGLKPASLFRYQFKDTRRFALEFKGWREYLSSRGLQLRILKRCSRGGGYLLYLYRVHDLQATLTEPGNRAFLRKQGYPDDGDVRGNLFQLAERLCLSEEFPHEIGVFLGYPLEDVEGFICNKGKNYTCCGCWKAYGDPQAARRTFARYRACTNTYRERYHGGTPVTRLVVAA